MEATKKEIEIGFVAAIIGHHWFDEIYKGFKKLKQYKNRGVVDVAATISDITLNFCESFHLELLKNDEDSWTEIYETFAVSDYTELIDLWTKKYIQERFNNFEDD